MDELDIKKLIREMDYCIDNTASKGKFSIRCVPTLRKSDNVNSSQNYNFRSLNYVHAVISDYYRERTNIYRYKMAI
ncbi:MAG: hypothetical protein AABY14_03365 [Nanoarchaeota archaeon]